jgi:hypothetical protein
MLAGGLVAGLACYLAETWSCACWRMQTTLMAADIKKMPEIKGTRFRGLIVSLGGIEDWSRQACGGGYGQTLLVRAGAAEGWICFPECGCRAPRVASLRLGEPWALFRGPFRAGRLLVERCQALGQHTR